MYEIDESLTYKYGNEMQVSTPSKSCSETITIFDPLRIVQRKSTSESGSTLPKLIFRLEVALLNVMSVG